MTLRRSMNRRRSKVLLVSRRSRLPVDGMPGGTSGKDLAPGGRPTGDRNRGDRPNLPISGPAVPLQKPTSGHGAEARRRPRQAGKFDQCGVRTGSDRIEESDRVLFDSMPRTEGVDHSPKFFDRKAGTLDPSNVKGRIRIEAYEHFVDSTVARRGDEGSRSIGGSFTGSLHQQANHEGHAGDDEDGRRRDKKPAIIAMDREPDDGRRHDDQDHSERPWILKHEIGEETRACGIGHDDLPRSGGVPRGQGTAPIGAVPSREAYPVAEVTWE
jgi:hypothetical protein